MDIYGIIASSILFGIGATLFIAFTWQHATTWLMDKMNVSDPLDKYYKNLF